MLDLFLLVFIFSQCIGNGICIVRASYLIFHPLEETGHRYLTDFFVYMSIISGFIHSSLTKTVFVTQLRSDLSNPWLYQENKFNSLLFKKLFWELHLQKPKGVFLIMISIFMWPESCAGKVLTLLQFQHQNTNFTLSWPWICFETTSPV